MVEVFSIWKTKGKDIVVGKYPVAYVANGKVLYVKEDFIVEKTCILNEEFKDYEKRFKL